MTDLPAPPPLDGDQRAESIAVWLEGLAEAAERRAIVGPGKHHDSFTGQAAFARGAASGVRAGLDLPQ